MGFKSHTNYYRKNVVWHLIASCDGELNTDNITFENKLDHTSFVQYSSKINIRHCILTERVLSLLFYQHTVTNTTFIGAMLLQINDWYLCQLEIDDDYEVIKDQSGYTYFCIALSDIEYPMVNHEMKYIQDRSINVWKVGYGLPSYWDKSNHHYYCFITDNGYVLNDTLNWKILA